MRPATLQQRKGYVHWIQALRRLSYGALEVLLSEMNLRGIRLRDLDARLIRFLYDLEQNVQSFEEKLPSKREMLLRV